MSYEQIKNVLDIRVRIEFEAAKIAGPAPEDPKTGDGSGPTTLLI